jgi:hypothetical protein
MNWVHELNNIPLWKKYSQSHEEAYLKHILQNIEPENKTIVEFGAWDGYHLSNTRYFIEEMGYKALLFDGDNRGNEDVIQAFITAENAVELLQQNNCPKSFDLFCIDLDGNDYYILDKVLANYKPSVIIAEYNPIHPITQSVAIKYDASHTWNNDNYYGFSFMAGINLAIRHDYICIFQNDNLNMYFVSKDKLSKSLNLDGDSLFDALPIVNTNVTHYHPPSNKTSWVIVD